MNSAQRRAFSLRSLLLSITLVGILALSGVSVSAAKILMIVNSIADLETPTNANDVEVRDLLVSKGHTVNVADDTTVAAADTVGFDLVIISSSVGSGEAGVAGLSRGQFRTSRQPVICYEPALWDELLFQRSDVYNNAGGQTAIGIVSTNSAHPLAAGKTGVVEVTDVAGGSTVTMNSSQLPIDIGPDAILIATNATPSDLVADAAGRAAIWGFDRGARLVDGATTTAGRKVAFFYNASTAPGAYNQAAQDLFLAAVNWTLTTPADAPIVVIWRAPTALNASPGGLFAVDLEDSATSQVNTNTISLAINGNPATPSITQAGTVTTVTFQSPTLFGAGTTNSARLIYSNRAAPAQTFTNTLQFIVTDYVTLASSTAYPLAAADTSAPGFRARVVEANTASGTLANSSARAEDQLAGRLIDAATGQPFANEATTTGTDANGYFTDPDVINWSQDANGVGAEIGNFRAPASPDEPIPGIPGTDGINNDNIAAELLTFLELQAGAYTFGVHSDDGFLVASGADPLDVLRTTLGAFEGGRGSADTLFTFVAPVAGLYPFRVLWYEGNGGANLEFFSVDPATGNRILINDRSNPKAIKAWRRVTGGGRPYVSLVSPLPNNRKVPVESALEFTFTNQGSAVNTNAVQVTLNGQAVPLTGTSTSGNTVKVIADPTGNLSSSTDYTVRLVYSDNATQPNTVTNQFSFSTVRAPINLPPLQESADGLVVIEAENFDANTPTDTHAWEFDKTPAGYTGAGTMYALPDAPGAVINYPDSLTGAPRLDYKVNFVKTGTHYFWFRGSDGGGNSINAGLDGDSPGDTMNNIDQGCCGTRLVPGGTTYTWVGATAGGRAAFDITTPGVHTINLWMREDGQIVDKMLITTNAAFTPLPSVVAPNDPDYYSRPLKLV